MAMIDWTIVASDHECVVRVARSATLLTTRPRALPPSLGSLLRDACARLAPHATFALTSGGRRRAIAHVNGERLEVGVFARDLVCLTYLLACRSEAAADPSDALASDLASATSPFGHWLD